MTNFVVRSHADRVDLIPLVHPEEQSLALKLQQATQKVVQGESTMVINDASTWRSIARLLLEERDVELRQEIEVSTDGEHLNWNFGSQDLIQLAGFAIIEGFQVVNFGVADDYLNPIDSIRENEVSAAMVSMLKKYGPREVSSAMRDEFENLYVIHLTLLSKHTGENLVIRRKGIVNASFVIDAIAMLELVNKARKELKLG